MTITYPLSLPTNATPNQVTVDMQYVVAANASIFTREAQAYKHQGEQWVMEFSLPQLTRAEAMEWIAFRNKLRGSYGTFLMGDPSGRLPRGATGGSPLVAGAGQVGYELDIDGCTADVTGWLLKGDYFQLGTGLTARLHQLVDDADTDGSGATTLHFVPAIITAPADNAALVVTAAKGLFRLESPTVSFTAIPGEDITGQSFRAFSVI